MRDVREASPVGFGVAADGAYQVHDLRGRVAGAGRRLFQSSVPFRGDDLPVRKVAGGYRWGKHGKVYKSRAGAERQARAAYAHGYRGDAKARLYAAKQRLDASSPVVELPPDHRAGMPVPGGANGGARCSTCRYRNGQNCTNEYFVRWNNGSPVIPGPVDAYCSDWYED